MLPGLPGAYDQVLVTWPFELKVRVGAAGLASENEFGRLHVDHEIAAFEQRDEIAADVVGELSLRQTLRLPGQDEAAGFLHRGFQFFLGHEENGRLHRGEDDREERQADEGEFDRGRAVPRTQEFDRRSQPPPARRKSPLAAFDDGPKTQLP